MNNPLYDEEALAELLTVHEQDPDKFMDMVMTVIKNNPDIVVKDGTAKEKKILALGKICDHYVEKEEYENCVLIQQLEKRINEA